MPANLLPAREQMAFTLGFHIILVPFGVAFTFLMLVANWRGLRGDADALVLAERWSKVAAVLFAVGAVSGTVLSFEMGLLWPGLMGRYGGAYGIPFAVEGIFFFLEAIFIAIYIYGWRRLSPRAHLWTGIPVVVSGIGGTASVVAANAWMNQPGGITIRNGKVVAVDAWQVFFNRAFGYEFVHMLLAAYVVAGFVVAGVYAAGMLKGRRDRYHRIGFLIPFTVAAVVMPLQIFVGDVAARAVFADQPAKFAAIEVLPRTATHVPETLGGVLIGGHVRFGIRIPDAASLLAGFSPSTRIQGLDAVPVADRTTGELVSIVHLSFDAMVGSAFAHHGLAIWFLFTWRRPSALFLRCASVAGVVSIVCLEAGWIVTEVGRQPWTVVGLLKTRDAVNRSGSLWPFFAGTVALYAVVGVATVRVLRGMRERWEQSAVPYGP